MSNLNETVNMKLIDIVTLAESIGNEVTVLNEKIDQLQKELLATTKIRHKLTKESNLISNFAQEMLKANGNIDKQNKIKKRYSHLLAKKYTDYQETKEPLYEDCDPVDKLIENLPNQITEIAKQIVVNSGAGNKE